jgi:hypothetical protein
MYPDQLGLVLLTILAIGAGVYIAVRLLSGG